jgi:hypothetical protein
VDAVYRWVGEHVLTIIVALGAIILSILLWTLVPPSDRDSRPDDRFPPF